MQFPEPEQLYEIMDYWKADPARYKINAHNLETVLGVTVEYPYAMDTTDVTRFPVPWHWHAELEFIYIVEGSEDIITSRGKYTAKGGQAYFLNTNVLDMKKASEGASRTREIGHLFHPVLISGHFGSLIEQEYMNPVLFDPTLELVLMTDETPAGAAFVEKIRELTLLQIERAGERRHAAIETRNLLSQMWLLLLEELEENRQAHARATGQSADRIRPMMQYINDHYREKMALSDIAAASFVSERECLRIFRSSLGRTPFEYLTDVRLEQARSLLAEGRESITDIALACGFSDSAYFARVFRKNTGMTPREYRQSLR